MDLEQINLVGGALGVLVTIASIVFGIRGWWKRSVAPSLRKMDDIALLIAGRPAITAPERPNVTLAPALPGALERLTSLDDGVHALVVRLTEVETSVCDVQCGLDEVRGQMTTNGGTTLRDAVNRIEDRLGEAS